MSTTSPDTPEPIEPPPASRQSRSWRSIAKIVLLVIVGAVAVALTVPSPRLPQGILTATSDDRAADGYRQEGEVSGGAFTASAVKLQSNRNVTTASATAQSGGARVFDRTLAIFNRDDDLLMRRLGLELFERLRGGGRFEQIRYLPAGEYLPDGEPLPEVFVTLDMESWEEGGLPGNRQFEGRLLVTASDQFRRSSNSSISHLSPPQVQFRWQAEVNYQAKQSGIETSGARYQAVSRELADEVAGKLTSLLDDLATKHGRPGEIPQQFYPTYTPPPAFDFLTELGAQKLLDGPCFMRSTLAVWNTPDDRTPEAVIAAVSNELTAAGWPLPERGEPGGTHLRAAKENEVVVVFRDDDGTFRPKQSADTPARMFIVYTRDMPADDIYAGVQQMLQVGADESLLVMFQDAWHRHRELVEEYFRAHSPTDPASWQMLAQLRKKNDPDGAREALLRAASLHKLAPQGASDSSLKRLAEELGVDELPSQLSEEMIRELGLVDLRESGEIELSLADNEQSAIWLGNEDQKQHWLLLTPVQRRGGVPRQTLRVQVLELRGSNSSRSDQTVGHLGDPGQLLYTHRIGQNETVQVFSAATQPNGRFLIKVQRR